MPRGWKPLARVGVCQALRKRNGTAEYRTRNRRMSKLSTRVTRILTNSCLVVRVCYFNIGHSAVGYSAVQFLKALFALSDVYTSEMPVLNRSFRSIKHKNKKMKNLIITSIVLIFGFLTLNAQDPYTDGMTQAFKLWDEKKPTEAIALFDRIAQAETENWIPLYHVTNVLIVESFRSKDKTERMAMLEKAKASIKSAHERSPDNSELLTMEGMLYTGYVAMEPQVYAMKYSQKIMELHDKAIELNPENPRAHANRIEYEMGTARFFGQDLQPFCDRLEKVIPKFEAQNLEVPFCPKYGKERVESIIENCGK